MSLTIAELKNGASGEGKVLRAELAYCTDQIEYSNPTDKTKKIRFVKVAMADLTGNVYALVYVEGMFQQLKAATASKHVLKIKSPMLSQDKNSMILGKSASMSILAMNGINLTDEGRVAARNAMFAPLSTITAAIASPKRQRVSVQGRIQKIIPKTETAPKKAVVGDETGTITTVLWAPYDQVEMTEGDNITIRDARSNVFMEAVTLDASGSTLLEVSAVPIIRRTLDVLVVGIGSEDGRSTIEAVVGDDVEETTFKLKDCILEGPLEDSSNLPINAVIEVEGTDVLEIRQ